MNWSSRNIYFKDNKRGEDKYDDEHSFHMLWTESGASHKIYLRVNKRGDRIYDDERFPAMWW